MQRLGKKLWNWIEKIVYTLLGIMCKKLKKELSEQTLAAWMQFIKFGIVGVSNTIISYLLYVISLFCFQTFGFFPKSDYILAQVISFFLSVLWSFYWNHKVVFVQEEEKKRSVWKALLKTYLSYSFTGLFLNSILLMVWVQKLHISEFLAPIINLIFSVPINFFINKFWAFR